jgi:Domain of unknown function (DUF222)
MDSNTHSTPGSGGRPAGPAAGLPDDGLAGLMREPNELAVQDVQGLSGAARTQRLLAWRQQLDRQEGLWLKELAAIDAGGLAGADRGEQAASTAAWLRNRLRMSVSAAHSAVRTARALFGGALPETAAALCAGEISPPRWSPTAPKTSPTM